MNNFPMTNVGGIEISRMIVGTNWMLGYSHTSIAKDKFITSYQTKENITAILETFLSYGINAVMGMPVPLLSDAIRAAEDRTGRKMHLIATPAFNIMKGGPSENEPERVLDYCQKIGATFCFPHQCVTDRLVDLMNNEIRNINRYSAMIRERNMIPGLSTHMPETVVVADRSGADIETYIQIYNAIGFLMHVEVDWVMRIIKNARKPVMTIKPMAAGRLLPPVGLAFVWNTLRDIDMVTVGTATPDEAKECIELSLDFLNKRIPQNELQKTRSKRVFDSK